MKSTTAVMPILRVLVLMGITSIAGCATQRASTTSPPDVRISVTKVDAAANTATVVLTNHSRRRVLIRTDDLEWAPQADVREVDRPNYDYGKDLVVMTHDARLEPGETRAYMEVRLQSVYRPRFPTILACWDNPRWVCERYWRIPSALPWDALVETPNI